MKTEKTQVARQIIIEQRRTIKYALQRPRTEKKFKEFKQQKIDGGIRENLFPHLGVLFIHIPKTAGTSLHQALTEAEDYLINTEGEKLKAGITRPSLHKHATAAEWRDEIGHDKWNSLFKFCLVRNPFDLMVSSYLWWLQKAKTFPATLRDSICIEEMGDFDTFMRSRYGRFFINEFAGTISDWFTEKRRDTVDFIGRFENIETDVRHVLSRSAYPTLHSSLPRTNTTERSSYREYYTETSRKIVERRFADIIERFGYNF